MTSLLTVNESIPNAKLIAVLSQLQVEVQNFILRLASEFSQRKEQLISLINNYDLMLSVLSVIEKKSELSLLQIGIFCNDFFFTRSESKKITENLKASKSC
jgi:hypothetical protein